MFWNHTEPVQTSHLTQKQVFIMEAAVSHFTTLKKKIARGARDAVQLTVFA